MQHERASRSRERDGSSSAAYAGRMSAVSLTRSCFPRRDLTLMNLVTLPASAHAYTRRTVCTKSCRTGCRQSRNGKSLRCRFGAAASKTASFSTACGSQSTTRTWRAMEASFNLLIFESPTASGRASTAGRSVCFFAPLAADSGPGLEAEAQGCAAGQGVC